jgi:hypothetical protein
MPPIKRIGSKKLGAYLRKCREKAGLEIGEVVYTLLKNEGKNVVSALMVLQEQIKLIETGQETVGLNKNFCKYLKLINADIKKIKKIANEGTEKAKD